MSAKKAREELTSLEVIKASRIVTGMELKTGIGLLVFAAVVPIAFSLWWGRPASFAEFTSLIFLATYVFAVIATFAIIFLQGLERLTLPDKFMLWLGGATIGEIATLLAFILRQNFKS